MTRWQAAWAWTGGALFAASLAITAHAFVVTWGASRPVNSQWPSALGLNAALVAAFALHHSLFARGHVKQWMAGVVPVLLVRSVYVWIASLMLIAVVWLWRPIGGELYTLEGWAGWSLFAVQAMGVALIAASVRAIDGLELAGIRPTRAGSALYAQGPYSLVRHPLYLGWVLIVLGTPHLTGDRLAFAALTTTYLVLAMPWEERALVRLYGDIYRSYMLKVRWRLLPWLY